MAVITLSRELGSFGTQIAEEVAARIGASCVDKEVLAEMAQQAGLSVEAVAEAEERLLSRPKVFSEEMRALFAAQARHEGQIDEEVFARQMKEAIRSLASLGQVVLVGRGAHLILADYAQALHVYVYAPPDVRAARIQARRNLPDLETAQRVVQQADARREAWFRRFFTGVNWKDPRHYHLLINTGRVPAEVAVDLIVQAALTAQPAHGS
jgi:cytidylate kinase